MLRWLKNIFQDKVLFSIFFVAELLANGNFFFFPCHIVSFKSQNARCLTETENKHLLFCSQTDHDKQLLNSLMDDYPPNLQRNLHLETTMHVYINLFSKHFRSVSVN